MSNLRLPQGSGAGGDAGGHNELEEVPNIYQLLNQHPPELWKIFVAINISYNVAETNNSKDKYKNKFYSKNTKWIYLDAIYAMVKNLTVTFFNFHAMNL